MAIGTIPEQYSKQGRELRTWNFLGVYWKNIMWKFQRSIKTRIGISMGDQESLGFWPVFGNSSRAEGRSFILPRISKDRVTNLGLSKINYCLNLRPIGHYLFPKPTSSSLLVTDQFFFSKSNFHLTLTAYLWPALPPSNPQNLKVPIEIVSQDLSLLHELFYQNKI